MTSRRGSPYSIQSDEHGIGNRNYGTEQRRKGKILSGTEYTQGSAISQRQVPEMPIISGPEFELSIGSSTRYKSHSKGSDSEPVKAVLHGAQGQRLGNVATSTQSSDELLEHPEKVPQRGGNSDVVQWRESTSIQTSKQKDKRLAQQKEGGKQGRSPSSFYQQATSQPISIRREE
ncbi:hypothetical protein O181_127880 [Austropuccinia psidii MF-1]|uniref:Uncharacterized protein n=1 Tax=Austropuccinia psidii MF-1 TaxID=1389203 RepID=A0A9Q3KU22_9BASI|nr:hypothetical protein [Austropuccinia psidii MF-1]